MNKLFVSYSYVGKSDNVIYQGFSNTILGSEINTYEDLTFLESITELCQESCFKELGFDTCTVTVLFFHENVKEANDDEGLENT